jgi:hypothetical protein
MTPLEEKKRTIIEYMINGTSGKFRCIAEVKAAKLLDEVIEMAKNGMFTIDDMKYSFEVGRNYQLTGENNFNEMLNKIKEAKP